jgi:hypothetical protein
MSYVYVFPSINRHTLTCCVFFNFKGDFFSLRVQARALVGPFNEPAIQEVRGDKSFSCEYKRNCFFLPTSRAVARHHASDWYTYQPIYCYIETH